MNIAVIPARGGSKRIKNKNIYNFCGKPIIYYSIINAIESKLFDKVIVSTDNNKIADISRSFGAETPFKRPKEISDDYATTLDVMSHSSKWLLERYDNIESICCIYATAPLIQIEDLVKAYNDYKMEKWNYIFSATNFCYPIERALKKNSDDSVIMYFPDNFNSRSQDFEPAFHDAGQFYIGKVESWIKKELFFNDKSKAIIIPSWRVQDIDTLEDWERAEKIYQLLNKNGKKSNEK
jgi:pseudaminic acid cytidylyltransferase